MLTNPTIDMLRELGLSGIASAFHELAVQPDVRSLEHGEWLLLELPSQQPLHFGPVPARPTRGEHAAKRREEMEARLQRIAAKLGAADRDEFENGIEAWWTRPLVGRSTPLDLISVGNYQWERVKQQLAAIEPRSTRTRPIFPNHSVFR